MKHVYSTYVSHYADGTQLVVYSYAAIFLSK